MNYKALVKQLRLDLLRGEDRANWFHQIYEATEAIESLIADCVRKDEARERANKQAQQWEGRCKMLEAELAQAREDIQKERPCGLCANNKHNWNDYCLDCVENHTSYHPRFCYRNSGIKEG